MIQNIIMWVFILLLFYEYILAKKESSNSSMFSFADGYDKHRPPPAPKGKNSTEVELLVHHHEVSEIDEMSMAITMILNIRMVWVDTRVIMKKNNYKKGFSQRISPDEFHKFWKPDIHVGNMIKMEVQKFYEDLVLMRAFNRENKTCLTHLVLFELKFRCPMDFSKFPFDVHSCPIYIKSFSYLKTEMTLVWYDFTYHTPKKEAWMAIFEKLPLYKIKTRLMYGRDLKGKRQCDDCLVITIVVKRLIGFHILQTYLPSAAFVLVSWISFIVPPDAIPGRMVLLVTTMLTLTTMYLSLRSETPPTSSLKALEIWMMSCITFVFGALVEYAAVLFLKILQIGNSEEVSTIKARNSSTTKRLRPGFCGCLKRLTTKATPEKSKKFPPTFVVAVRNGFVPEEKKFAVSLQLNRLDKMSLVLFPLLFILFSFIYWIHFMSKRSATSKKINEEYGFA